MFTMNRKYEILKYKLKEGISVDVLRDENFQAALKSGINPEVELRTKRTGMEDLQDMVLSESFEDIKVIEDVSDQKRLTQQDFNTQKKLGQQRGKTRAKKLARKVLVKVGNGVETATTALSFAQGGVDTAAGSDMIEKARNLKAQGGISQANYNEMMRNGRIRIAQGSFGIANGMKNVATFVGKRVEKNVLKKAGEAGIKLLKDAKRFGSIIGGAISVGTGIVSMTKNAYAASDAAKQGIVGKTAMYAVMAAIDGISVILDIVSMVLDVVFPPLGPIVDLITTFLQVVNTILGFFADLIDFRTPEQRVRDDFKAYVDSEAFQTYVNNMASEYKERGFDIFTYYVDAESAGIEGDKEILQAEKKTVTKALTDKAKKDFNNKQLRVALLDTTSSGKTLKGRANDDEIVAGFGLDRIYGKEGDDILFGRGGDDSIYGGPGNDYLNGGTGRDTLLGGTGDDVIVCEPGDDLRCEGQEGEDILALSGKPLIYKEDLWNGNYITLGPEWEVMTHLNPTKISPVKGIYLDIGYTSGSGSNARKGRSGITLGFCFPGWPTGFNELIHKPAFLPSNDNLEQKFVDLFNTKNPVPLGNADELESEVLWFLAEKNGVKYFCDGISFYSVSTSSMRVARNAVNSIPTSYAFSSNGRLRYSGNRKLEALFVFAFRRSFIFDEFEKISAAQPDNLALLSNYIPTTVIGSNDHNVIDVSFGLGDVVYTGEGNNVISVGSTINWYHFTEETAEKALSSNSLSGLFNWAKYIVGGSGDNTLIIQYMNRGDSSTENSVYGQWQLRNIDNPHDTGSSSEYNTHVVYLKNIQTVEITAPLPRGSDKNFNIDAKNYDGASRYIINDGTTIFSGPLSTEKDVTVLPRRLDGNNYINFGKNTKNTISFKYYEDENFPIDSINIHQQHEYDKGEIIMKEKERYWRTRSVWLVNAMNVISSSTCRNIVGNDKENLLIAVGGQTAIDAKDGVDNLVSTRGRHQLTGGPGADTFVLHGPEVVEYLTISVVMGEDGNTIRCKTTIYGNWENGRLEIDVLKDDHSDVLLTAVEIIPAQGDEGKNLGVISKDTANRKLIFEPGSNFNYLKRNAAKVVRIKYTTTGSMATIKEDDDGNQLRFESIKKLDDLTAGIENDYLVFKDKSTPPRTVLIDHEWGNKLKNGILTNLFELILDFAQRFPVIHFRKNDKEFSRVTSNDTIKFLYKHLKHLETALGQEFDTIIDSTSPLLSDVGTEIDVGNGQNIILAKTRGKTYKLGPKASGSIIVANKFTRGSGKAKIEGGNDRNSLNTVVVGVGSGGAVSIQMGTHEVIITGASMNEVQLSQRNGMVYVKDSRQRDLIAGWDYFSCKNLIFKKSTSSTNENTQIIFDCKRYILENLQPFSPYNPITVSYGSSNRQLKLNCPFTKDNTIIFLSYNYKSLGLHIIFKDQTSRRHLYSDEHPYLVVTSDGSNTSYDLKMLVEAMRTRFKAGIKFSSGLIKDREICRFVVEKSKTRGGIHLPGGHSLTNRDLEC